MTECDMAALHRQEHVEQFLTSGMSQRAFARTCGHTRTSLRRWIKRHRPGRLDGLSARAPRRNPHNRTASRDEKTILEHVKDHPGHGPQRIADELGDTITVGRTGVYGVLRRNGLNHRSDRLEWARVQHGQIVTKSELETAREKAKKRHVDVSYPGELWGIDTFLIGRIKGIGKVYHYLAVDLASGFLVTALYTECKARWACHFLEHHLVAKAKGLGVHRVLTDNGTEFTAARWRDDDGRCEHPFHHLAERLGVRLTFTKPRHPWTNGACERAHQTLLHEFYQPAFCRKIYTSVEELAYDLQLFLQDYNHRRPHRGRHCKGRTPNTVYRSGKTPHKDFNLRAV